MQLGGEDNLATEPAVGWLGDRWLNLIRPTVLDFSSSLHAISFRSSSSREERIWGVFWVSKVGTEEYRHHGDGSSGYSSLPNSPLPFSATSPPHLFKCSPTQLSSKCVRERPTMLFASAKRLKFAGSNARSPIDMGRYGNREHR